MNYLEIMLIAEAQEAIQESYEALSHIDVPSSTSVSERVREARAQVVQAYQKLRDAERELAKHADVDG